MKTLIFVCLTLLIPTVSKAQKGNCYTAVNDSIRVTPTKENIAELQYMREEELMAGDVYRYFSTLWNVPVFSNISRSEDVHASRIKFLLDKYELEDPGKDHKPGVFQNPDIQDLYNNLIIKGEHSFIEALKTGSLIEETDIHDLSEAINHLISQEDFRIVYTQLKKASGNHLRAFTRHLQFQGVEYSPVLLTVDEYNSIIGN